MAVINHASALVVILAVVAAACNDAEERCDLLDYPEVSLACRDAMLVAVNTSPDLRPDQAEVTQWFKAIELARRVDSHLVDVHKTASVLLDSIHATSSDPAIVSAWDRGEVVTGIDDVDQLLEAIGMASIERYENVDTSVYYRLLLAYPGDTQSFVSALNALGRVEASVEGGAVQYSDIEVADADDGSVITFWRGWGDCYMGCIWKHYWDVWVSAGIDEAELQGERGDPLLDGSSD